jgi:hypothetical protein
MRRRRDGRSCSSRASADRYGEMLVRSATGGCTRGGADVARRVKGRQPSPAAQPFPHDGHLATGRCRAVLLSGPLTCGASQDRPPAWLRRAPRALEDVEKVLTEKVSKVSKDRRRRKQRETREQASEE